MEEESKLIWFDLQRFAEDDGTGEKTEPATPRRREEARKKGQVFKSTDLNAAIVLIAGFGAVFACLPGAFNEWKSFFTLYFTDRNLLEINIELTYFMLTEVIFCILKIVWPILLGAFVGALLISYIQVGFVFSSEPLKPKLSKLSPAKGLKRIFSKRALVELAKSLMKVIITGYIVYSVLSKNFYMFSRMVDMELNTSLLFLGSLILEMALKVILVFIIVGIIDYIYQWYEHEVSLRMSKYEVKQEYKQNEGDPLIKSRQRHIQREMAMRRMMAEVPKADVVITNPTHYAVALQYKAKQMSAPVVIAKGQGYVALRIIDIAKEHKIAIAEDPPLARSLFALCKIGDMIPEDLYQAVAEVLAFVYQQRKMIV